MSSVPMIKGGEEKPSSMTFMLFSSAGGQAQARLPFSSREDLGYTKFKVTGSAREIAYYTEAGNTVFLSFNTEYAVPQFNSYFTYINTAQNGSYGWTYWEFYN